MLVSFKWKDEIFQHLRLILVMIFEQNYIFLYIVSNTVRTLPLQNQQMPLRDYYVTLWPELNISSKIYEAFLTSKAAKT